jgi:hypothetical protein
MKSDQAQAKPDRPVPDARALREALEAERQARLKAPYPGTPTDRSDD